MPGNLILEAKITYVLIVVLTLCIILIPFFVVDQQRIRIISQTGTLGNTLLTSVGFKVLEGVTIGSALPMVIDFILDKIFNIPTMEIARLSLPQLVSIISAIIYLCTYEQYYATYLFTCIVGMKLLVPSAVIFYTLSEGVITSKLKLRRWVFVLPLIALAIARIMTSYKILFPEYTIITTLVTIFFAIGVTLFVLVQSYWFLAFWRLYKVDSDLGLAETKELSFAVGIVLFFLSYITVSLIFNTQKNWLDTSETVLMCLHLIQTILVVWLTVLPGRLLRKVAEVYLLSLIHSYSGFYCISFDIFSRSTSPSCA